MYIQTDSWDTSVYWGLFSVNHTVATTVLRSSKLRPTSVRNYKLIVNQSSWSDWNYSRASLAESPVVSESKPANETQRQIVNSEEAIVEAKENKEPEEADQPVTKQENYQLNCSISQQLPPMTDGKASLPVGNGDGSKVFQTH